jgi:response regulator NasT
MAKFVVAFRDRDTAEKIAGLLRENGYEVMRICTAGGEVRRTFKTLQDGILIAGYRLKDEFIDQIAEDLSESVEILCITKPEYIAKIESPRVFRIQLPVTHSVLTAWADMMLQLHGRSRPRRSEPEQQLIEQAKQILMKERNFSEPQAHRFLQNLSMRLGITMAKAAQRIINHDHV